MKVFMSCSDTSYRCSLQLRMCQWLFARWFAAGGLLQRVGSSKYDYVFVKSV